MAADAVVLNPPGGVVGDAQVVPVGFEGHGQRVAVAVARLGQHLVEEGVVRQVAVHAGGPGPVRTVLPGVVQGLHGVTGDAHHRVTRQVGKRLGFADQVGEHPDRRQG